MNNKKTTYTKKIMTLIVIVALIDLQLPFVLAFFNRDNIAETLGGLIVTEIIGVFLVYCAKSFFETRESERVRLQEKEMDALSEQSSYDDFDIQEVEDYTEEENNNEH